MLYRPLLVVGALTLLAACGQKEEATVQQPDANPAATIPTPANEAGATDFVAKAAASDMFEMDAAHVALDRSQNTEVKAFAQGMIDAHSKSTFDLKQAISTSGAAVAPPTALPGDLAEKVGDLKTIDPKEFDKKYMNGQVDAHQGALDLMQRYANDGDNPAIKAFAAAAAPVVQTHLDHAKSVLAKLK